MNLGIDWHLISKTLIFLIDVVGVTLIFLVYFSNPKAKLNKIFILMTFLMFIWVNCAFLARLSSETLSLALIWIKTAWAITLFFFALIYSFVLYFTEEKRKYYRYLNIISLFIGIVFIFVVFLTDFIIKDIKFENSTLYIVYGKFVLLFFAIMFFLTILSFALLFKKYLKPAKKQEKKKIKYLLIGFFFFFLMNSIFNILYPVFFKMANLYEFGDYSTIFLIGSFAYAIAKRELFGIKIVLTVTLVGLITILLGLDILILTSALAFKIYKGLILVIFVYLGYSLIKSVLKEIKYREELRKAYKKLKKLDQAKSRFLSMASHQLRAPLTVIKGYVSMILDGVYGEISGTVREKLERSYQSNERLTGLVSDLLNVSRIEAGKIDMKIEKTNLESLISVLIKELSIQARKKGLFLKFEKPEKELPEIPLDKEKTTQISLDKEKTTQVILNLIDNAIKYTEKGGVTIKLNKSAPKKALITIQDTGMGIKEGDMDSLFEIFSRGSAKNHTTVKGTGLGLFIAKRFIELQKGKIWAESKGRGKGSVFCIELPIK